MFDNHSYAKGRVLHMLRYYLGDEAFIMIKKYLNDNAFSTVEIHQLHCRKRYVEKT